MARTSKVDAEAQGVALIPFGTWLVSAQKRADVADVLGAILADKKVKEDAKLVNIKKRYADKPGFAIVEKRYLAYCRRVAMKKAA